ncbi:DUF3617 domain-containing protein [Pseudoduganella ginsengisoli]|uniref:DUF3617 family protein n=1 Tax=Pseudoduganella ginsengisoli TaxID=1462440 RepID=A0A6L6Q9Z7_9BURK|nr:DUF3617 domain-containing protein [Pseudoduganella ginsengisoli]MTW06011.1 DUF3617 family protein [Pseudoduganella ginsengisoli]
MNRIPLLAALAAAASFTFPALAADTMRPGLWEITSTIQSGNSQAMAAMAEARKQMAAMAPEQRKMIEDMMAKQGVGMAMNGDGSVKVTYCVTKEMAARREIPTSQQGHCTSTSTPTATGMNVSFKCDNPPSSGTGQVTLQGDSAYTTTMHVTSTARGKPETMTVDASGRWLSADCGAKAPK